MVSALFFELLALGFILFQQIILPEKGDCFPILLIF